MSENEHAPSLTLEGLERLAELEEKATPGPWEPAWTYESHIAGDESCKRTCGQGLVPRNIRRAEGEDLEMRLAKGWPHEWHEMDTPSYCEQMLGPEKVEVFGMGQDYDDSGATPDVPTTTLIAALRNNAKELLRLADIGLRHEAKDVEEAKSETYFELVSQCVNLIPSEHRSPDRMSKMSRYAMGLWSTAFELGKAKAKDVELRECDVCSKEHDMDFSFCPWCGSITPLGDNRKALEGMEVEG